MIAYDLRCGQGHTFEGWFESADAFEIQKNNGLITCPVCENGEISRILSPVKSVGQRSSPDDSFSDAIKAVTEYVNSNFENVGTDFAKEALKIHYGVSPKRNIRGSSTESEEETLKSEGIKFFKLPVPKIDAN